MKEEVTILIAEDDEGHAKLIQKNLHRAGLHNKTLLFRDGREILDFLHGNHPSHNLEEGKAYLLLLDIRMPRVDGIEVLERIKADPELCKLPVIMVTTTDNPREVESCYNLGCSTYITKPVDYDKFVEAVNQLGFFLMATEIPRLTTRDG
jgi:CheY-like chemotaxis protein